MDRTLSRAKSEHAEVFFVLAVFEYFPTGLKLKRINNRASLLHSIY